MSESPVAEFVSAVPALPIADRFDLAGDAVLPGEPGSRVVGSDRTTGLAVELTRIGRIPDTPELQQHAAGIATRIASLEHPNIIPVVLVAHDADGIYIAARQPAERRIADLSASRDEPALPYSDALPVLVGVGKALVSIHRRLPAHGAVGEATISIGEPIQAVVMDPGYAALAALTPGAPALRPPDAYAPADVAPVSRDADIQAYGKLIYRLLTGRSPGALVIDRLAAAHMRRVVLRCIEPDERYASIEEALDAVVDAPTRQIDATESDVDEMPAAPAPPVDHAVAGAATAVIAAPASARPPAPGTPSVPAARPPAPRAPIEPAAAVGDTPTGTTCPHCGTVAKATDTYCMACGKALTELCPGCGTRVRAGSTFCPRCAIDIPQRHADLNTLREAEAQFNVGRWEEARAAVDSLGHDFDAVARFRGRLTRAMADETAIAGRIRAASEGRIPVSDGVTAAKSLSPTRDVPELRKLAADLTARHSRRHRRFVLAIVGGVIVLVAGLITAAVVIGNIQQEQQFNERFEIALRDDMAWGRRLERVAAVLRYDEDLPEIPELVDRPDRRKRLESFLGDFARQRLPDSIQSQFFAFDLRAQLRVALAAEGRGKEWWTAATFRFDDPGGVTAALRPNRDPYLLVVAGRFGLQARDVHGKPADLPGAIPAPKAGVVDVATGPTEPLTLLIAGTDGSVLLLKEGAAAPVEIVPPGVDLAARDRRRPVRRVHLNADARYAAAVRDDGRVDAWELTADGAVARRVALGGAEQAAVVDVGFIGPDRLVGATRDGTFIGWSLADGSQARRDESEEGAVEVTALAACEATGRFAVGRTRPADGGVADEVVIYHPTTTSTAIRATGEVVALDFGPNGSRLVGCTQSNVLLVELAGAATRSNVWQTGPADTNLLGIRVGADTMVGTSEGGRVDVWAFTR
jgi:hypothetical protein